MLPLRCQTVVLGFHTILSTSELPQFRIWWFCDSTYHFHLPKFLLTWLWPFFLGLPAQACMTSWTNILCCAMNNLLAQIHKFTVHCKAYSSIKYQSIVVVPPNKPDTHTTIWYIMWYISGLCVVYNYSVQFLENLNTNACFWYNYLSMLPLNLTGQVVWTPNFLVLPYCFFLPNRVLNYVLWKHDLLHARL